MSSEFYVEAVAYQQAAIEELERRAFTVKAMHPIKDKRARLRVAARYIENDTVNDFSPMEVIPTSVCLTTYDGGPEDFMPTPLGSLSAAPICGHQRGPHL